MADRAHGVRTSARARYHGDEQQSKNFPIFLLTVRRLLIVSQWFAI
jgi:hypothetical protein